MAEPVETVVVALAAGTGYTAGSPWEATVTIADNETPEISIQKVYDAFEGWTGEFEVTRIGDTSHKWRSTTRQAVRPRRVSITPRLVRRS